MKRLTILCLILLAVINSSGQTRPVSENTQDHYLRKSKNQKTTAWILLVGGIGMTIGGLGINLSQPEIGSSDDNAKGLWLFYLGSATALSSIPFFIGAHKNRKRAALVSLNKQDVLLPKMGGFFLKMQPALTLKMSL